MVCFPIPFLLDNELDSGSGGSKHDLLLQAERMIKKVVKIYGDHSKPRPKLVGLFTDNPNANKGMRKLIEKSAELQSYRVLPYGCACHSLNNHGKDLCKLGRIREIRKGCTILLKYFRNTSDAALHVSLKFSARNLPSYKLYLETDTRWHYLLRMVESLVRSMDAIDDVYNDWRKGTLPAPSLDMGDKANPYSVAGILSSDAFWKEVKMWRFCLKPITLCIKLLESDLAPISMLPAAYIYLYRLYLKLGSTRDKDLLDMMSTLGLNGADFVQDRRGQLCMLSQLKRRWNEITAHQVSTNTSARASAIFLLEIYLDSVTQAMLGKCIDEGVSFSDDGNIVTVLCNGVEEMGKLMLIEIHS